ncbi:hypothetical protein [Bradyrhizobium diazoefficiens]|uniref:hypothetical protein n=1 Tax=Bradyrhizobium diazoefficiens TaxID=1355477 RepID=UPI0027155544|nr:hypothetical protein [Bradyrhizobium diazoefficiens]WLB38390.1 hypothetical protein QIH78_00635 [Bradyrhizobium diazoefficiens]
MSQPKKPYVFEVAYTTDIPRRIGRGQDGDPIYAPLPEKSWMACLRYFEAVESFLSGTATRVPSLGAIAKIVHGTILSISSDRAKVDLFGPKAFVVIKDDDRPTEKRRPRIFDPVYVPALLMLAAAGGSFRFNDSKSKRDAQGELLKDDDRRFYVSFGRRAGQNVRALRIISDPRRGEQVHRINRQLDSNYHYDHRKSTMALRHDDSARSNRHFAGFSRKGRAAAIKAAGEHYERAIKLRQRDSVQHLGKSRGDYERQLARVFALADELHMALVKRRRSK